ncbi:hypothetical protein GSI_14326 [Ganoderma sinense ZZ0214-1]|uniref:DUF6699 domain-containing protein n=1 Tax=Ganoderma sinense ZZ0214-1 TaxID=1077348 RepID=A0A2G8RNC9_9APHY|nr:hypothetical protein GSI_14326 [Ganoderma sinense ZZ0214-1]
MPSYFRSLFGGHSSKSSSSHSRSHSQPPAPIYAATPAASATPATSATNMSRSYSHSARSNTPSPLRYATTDTRTAYGYGRAPPATKPRPEVHPHPARRASYKTPETPRTPLYTYATPPSSRSNSSSSIYPGTPGSLPRTSSSDTGHYGGARQPLRNNTWHPEGTTGSSSSYGSRGRSSSQTSLLQQTRSTTLHMHPVLAHTRLHRAPITYDVSFTPSARTVLDRATHSAIPSHTLSQPATDPPTPAGARLVLRSHKFPWPVIVTASHSSMSPSHSSSSTSSRPRFTVGPPSGHGHSSRPGTADGGASISNLDVLYAVHNTLMVPITPEEWEALGHGSKAQQKVTQAYQRRCTRMGGGWEGGVRRIDWLGEKTWLIGVEVDKAAGHGGAGKLVFGRG